MWILVKLMFHKRDRERERERERKSIREGEGKKINEMITVGKRK